MSHKSKKITLKRSAEDSIPAQEHLSKSLKKPKVALARSTSSLKISQESSAEESTQDLSQHEEESKNYRNLMKGASKAIQKIPLIFDDLLQAMKSRPKEALEDKKKVIIQYGVCKKKGPNMGRIFSSEKYFPGFKDVPKSFTWRDEIALRDLDAVEGVTGEGRKFVEMRTPSGKPIMGLRQYLDEKM